MKFLKKYLGLDQKSALKNYKMGIHFYNKLEYILAIEFFEKVLAEKSLANKLEASLAGFYCCRSHINVGVTYFAQNHSRNALYHFKKALAFNHEDSDLNYFIGICQNNIGEYQAAMKSFSKILEIEPWNIPTKLKMAIIFHNLEMWENAEEIHRSILKKHAHFADVHFHLGLTLMGQGKPQEAAEAFESALNINPGYTAARLKLGIVQIWLEQFDQAYVNLQSIIKKNPEYADVYYLMALVKDQQGDLPEALRLLEQALQISPAYKNALVKSVIILCQTGNREKAEQRLNQAQEIYPDDKRMHAVREYLDFFLRAATRQEIPEEIKTSLNDEFTLKELRNEFHKELDIMPSFSEIIAMFASSRYAREDENISNFIIPFITEQIQKNPTYPDLYNSLGVQLKNCKKTLEAENAFGKAVELNPDYITARINLLKALHENKKYNEAWAHGQYLLKKKLPFPDLFFTVASVLFELKQYEEALVNAKRVLKLRSAMKETHLLIARIYVAQGNHAAAIQSLETLLSSHGDSNLAREAKELLTKLTKNGGTVFTLIIANLVSWV